MKKRSKRGPYRMPRHEVIQPLDPSYRLIPLTQGQNAIVDAEDFEWLSKWNWIAKWDECSKTFYATRRKTVDDKTHPSMHRVILRCGKGEEGDHRNHNGLDNRRKNLRKCSRSQNRSNSGRQSDNTSGYKGVTFHKRIKKWMTQIIKDGKRIYLGYFTTPEQAAKVYDEAAKKYHGEFAYSNFPHILP